MIKDKLYDLAKDPKKTYKAPKAKEAVPFLISATWKIQWLN